MNFDLKQIATLSMILFAVIDVIGSLPVLLDLQGKVGKIQAEKATVVSGVIMIVFMFIGEQILNLIGIDVSSFAIAGSFIIFFLALEMILGVKFYKEETAATASVVPIAFPLIAGTGTLTTLLSLRAEYHIANILVATGTILSIFSLEINPSPLEETFVHGKSKRTALIGIMRPRLLNIGVKLLIIGSLMQIIFSFWGVKI